MKLLDLLTAFHNWLADKDFLWWPFSFLRPEPRELMTFNHTVTMTACFGGLTSVFFTVFALMNNVMSFDYLMLTFLSCFLGFFLWFVLITRPLWNRRARTLQKDRL